MSGDRRIFREVHWHLPMKLSTADGEMATPAYMADFHSNDFGLVSGLYHSELTEFLISIRRLNEQRVSVTFDDEGQALLDKKTGTEYFYPARQGESLPRLPVTFKTEEQEGWTQNSEGAEEDYGLYCQEVPDDEQKEAEAHLGYSKYLEHLRQAHIGCRTKKGVTCPQCDMAKKIGVKGHKKERPEEYKAKKFNDRAASDFSGPYIESHEKSLHNFAMIDDATGWVENYPTRYKSDCYKWLAVWIDHNGRPKRVRSDNAPEFKGDGSQWVAECRKHTDANSSPIFREYSSPYCPQQNGKVERWNQTNLGLTRANMQGVDKKLWDWCMKYVAWTWNRVALVSKSGKDKTIKKTPFQWRFKRKPKTSYFRRFGCLCYVRNETPGSKLNPTQYRPAVFLGYARSNNSYQVGTWKEDDRSANGWRWEVQESAHVKGFQEKVLVSDINQLKQDSQGMPAVPGVDPFGSRDPQSVSPGVPGTSGSSPQPEQASEGATPPVKSSSGMPKDVDFVVASEEQPQLNPANFPSTDELQQESPSSENSSNNARPQQNENIVDELLNDDDSGEVIQQGPVTIKKRGRKKGTKAQPHWKKPGRKSKPQEGNQEQNNAADGNSVETEPDDDVDFGRCLAEAYRCYVDDSEEEVLACTVQVTRREALLGPDSVKWMEADTLERTQLEAKNCWRPMTNQEARENVECLPTAVLYTRKRCGKFKARLVVLGNLQKSAQPAEIFAPTCSHPGTRYLLTRAAAEGMHLEQFDISNAFIQAMLNDRYKINIILPKHWGGQVVRLVKALYGLKLAPRAWYDCYAKFLKARGWEENPREPGLFRKYADTEWELGCSVYVDDNIIAGKCAKTMKDEIGAILAKFSGKVIPPTEHDAFGSEIRDLLGATLVYNRERRYMKIHMAGAIDRMLKKFNLETIRIVSSPCVRSSPEGAKEDKEDNAFPIRSLVGSLQYVATIARPDIQFAVNRVARQQSKPTVGLVKAAKRILAYLKGTRTEGLVYTQQNEQNSKSVCPQVAKEGSKAIGDVAAFSDADFAGCSVTFKSTSGSILYYRGVPVCWSAKRQDVRAGSTCESEYVAIHDTIKLCQGNGFLDWLLEQGKQVPLIFTDNKSALDLSKSSVITKRSKHISLRYHVVRDHCKSLCYVPTDLNKADPFTKPLHGGKYLALFKTDEIGDDIAFEAEAHYVNFSAKSFQTY